MESWIQEICYTLLVKYVRTSFLMISIKQWPLLCHQNITLKLYLIHFYLFFWLSAQQPLARLEKWSPYLPFRGNTSWNAHCWKATAGNSSLFKLHGQKRTARLFSYSKERIAAWSSFFLHWRNSVNNWFDKMNPSTQRKLEKKIPFLENIFDTFTFFP